ncbi:hypothetical protein ACTWJ9_23150 [Streptomyces sp. GDS52]|uniref:Uncharacterized protein n=2 Tax=Streptomyces TaxID=1883 RepID=A0ABY8K9Z7_9ACTN|nr:hypothetical protein [Streptomyces sp. HUAS 5]WGD43132.1 hypothetical protein PYS65_25010 [Streptomyces sp. HUAS 5]
MAFILAPEGISHTVRRGEEFDIKPPPLGEYGIENQALLSRSGYTLGNEPIFHFVNLERRRDPSKTNRNTVPLHTGPAAQHHSDVAHIALDKEARRAHRGNPIRPGKR